MTKSHEWEIVEYSDKHEVVARLWFDGRYVRSDNQGFLNDLKDGLTYGNDFEHSTEWLDSLPRIFKGGRLSVRKAKK